ncbi:MAG: hypothetical protein MUQ00_00940 [Candidatus Aminicenantes bacterium]|nr:hypothetical protein [Candidatus Aminicenantes bacterium]
MAGNILGTILGGFIAGAVGLFLFFVQRCYEMRRRDNELLNSLLTELKEISQCSYANQSFEIKSRSNRIDNLARQIQKRKYIKIAIRILKFIEYQKIDELDVLISDIEKAISKPYVEKIKEDEKVCRNAHKEMAHEKKHNR